MANENKTCQFYGIFLYKQHKTCQFFNFTLFFEQTVPINMANERKICQFSGVGMIVLQREQCQDAKTISQISSSSTAGRRKTEIFCVRGAQRSSFHNLLLDHTNYVLCKGLKIYNRNMLTRSS